MFMTAVYRVYDSASEIILIDELALLDVRCFLLLLKTG